MSKEESRIEIGGNSLLLWYGNSLIRMSKMFSRLSERYNNRGDEFIERGKKIIITNPKSVLYNPFTLIITFTVNNKDKYQLITQGFYKEKYKEVSENNDENPLTNQEIFEIIRINTDKWFLKK